MAHPSSQQVRARNRIQVSISTQDLHSPAATAAQLPAWFRQLLLLEQIRVAEYKCIFSRRQDKTKKSNMICSSGYQDSAVNQ